MSREKAELARGQLSYAEIGYSPGNRLAKQLILIFCHCSRRS
jgi:hypothetical protein